MGTTRYDDFTRPMDPGLAVQKINAAFGGIDPHDHSGAGRGGVIPGSAISGAVAEAIHATSADSATHATNADMATSANNGCPVGAVMAFARSTPPAGWLECNGQTVSRTTYAALFAAIGTTFGAGDGSTTFNLPNLQGEFVRGWDHGRGVDPGRVLGSFQSDSFKAHRHYYDGNHLGKSIGGSGASHWVVGEDTGPGDNTPVPMSIEGGPETRPRNVALMYCIKY